MLTYMKEFGFILAHLEKNPCLPEEQDSVKAFLEKLITYGASQAEKDEILADLDKITWLKTKEERENDGNSNTSGTT